MNNSDLYYQKKLKQADTFKWLAVAIIELMGAALMIDLKMSNEHMIYYALIQLVFMAIMAAI